MTNKEYFFYSGRINPFVIKKYLEQNKWKTISSNNKAIMEKNIKNRKFKVTIRYDLLSQDYPEFAFASIKTIAIAEKKKIEDVLYELTAMQNNINKNVEKNMQK